jgi:hypothetical protein
MIRIALPRPSRLFRRAVLDFLARGLRDRVLVAVAPPDLAGVLIDVERRLERSARDVDVRRPVAELLICRNRLCEDATSMPGKNEASRFATSAAGVAISQARPCDRRA